MTLCMPLARTSHGLLSNKPCCGMARGMRCDRGPENSKLNDVVSFAALGKASIGTGDDRQGRLGRHRESTAIGSEGTMRAGELDREIGGRWVAR